ncbi:glucokinase [Pedomonas sp. V897]|uniref:glucokinase n=1 Tax=Pedomonas sp. V897 TaxID=3446482 RepID=UPI003EE24FEA
MAENAPVLVGDIGGTNARFALARPGPDGKPALLEVRRYKSADFPSFIDAVRRYLEETAAQGAGLRRAVFAVATAVLGDTVRLTNSPWVVSAPEARAAFGLEEVRLVNDFQSIGRAVALMDMAHFGSIGPQPPEAWRPDMTLAVLGPGTGLGVCLMQLRAGRPVVLPSEAGHMAFAPANEREVEVLRHLQRRFGRVSNERLISGPGLVALHEALCAIAGQTPPGLPPEAITEAAAAAPDGPEAQAVQLFCEIYGSVAGDLVLAFGAWDGVCLAGNLTSVLLPTLRVSRFRQRFEDKGRFAPAMRSVPTLVLTRRLVGLLGTAAFALDGRNG